MNHWQEPRYRDGGILNGTTNYILTRMAEERLPYELVLKRRRNWGSPKLTRLMTSRRRFSMQTCYNCQLGFKEAATYNDVEVTGITKITPEALELASKNNYVVKLICEAGNGRLTVRQDLSRKSTACSGGTLNVASILTDLAGRITISGRALALSRQQVPYSAISCI